MVFIDLLMVLGRMCKLSSSSILLCVYHGATKSCDDDHEGVDLPSLCFDGFLKGLVFVAFGFNG